MDSHNEPFQQVLGDPSVGHIVKELSSTSASSTSKLAAVAAVAAVSHATMARMAAIPQKNWMMRGGIKELEHIS